MGFWHSVGKDLSRHRLIVAVTLILAAAHLFFTGLSWALVGWLGAILCISPAFRKWCWRQPIIPAFLGFVAALTLIFLIETYLGVSTHIFGTFDPAINPTRQPQLLEAPLIRGLGWFYSLHLGSYLELALLPWPVIGFIYLALHIRRRSRKHDDEDRIGRYTEALKKLLELASGFAFILGTLVFANAVDVNSTGLNNFAVLYEKEHRKLGANVAAIAQLDGQLTNLDDLNNDLLKDPPSDDAKQFADTISKLIDALSDLRQAQAEASKIDLITYHPDKDPLPTLTVPLPSKGSKENDEEPGKQLLLLIGNYLELQKRAEATEHDSDDLLARRNEALQKLTTAIAIALDRGHQLSPPEKVELLNAIVQRIAALVARDGIEHATREINALAEQARREAQEQRQANGRRQTDVAQFRAAMQNYLSQQKACLELVREVANFLQHDPDGGQLLTKLNDYRRRESQAPGAPLLQRPSLRTGSPNNLNLENELIGQISLQVYNQPNPPEGVLSGVGYVQILRTAFRNSGGNIEAAGFGLLLSWIDDACSRGQSDGTFIATLRQRAQGATPL